MRIIPYYSEDSNCFYPEYLFRAINRAIRAISGGLRCLVIPNLVTSWQILISLAIMSPTLSDPYKPTKMLEGGTMGNARTRPIVPKERWTLGGGVSPLLVVVPVSRSCSLELEMLAFWLQVNVTFLHYSWSTA